MKGPVKAVVSTQIVVAVCKQNGVGVDKDAFVVGYLTKQSRMLLTAGIISDLFGDNPTSIVELHRAYQSLLEELRLNDVVDYPYISQLVEEMILAGVISGKRGKYIKIHVKYKRDIHRNQFCLVIDPASMLKCTKLEEIFKRKLELHFKRLKDEKLELQANDDNIKRN